jgi:hypothetical protein
MERKQNAKTKKAGALRPPALKRREERLCLRLFLTAFLQTYYIDAPEAAAADAAFLCDFLACFFAAFLAGAEAAAGAAGAEACAKAAVANRPATRAAISFFML